MNGLERLELLIGDKVKEFKTKTVLIIGLGGVGGYAVEALTRLGIGHLILVDGDVIESTNINRQIIATTNTIGNLKTEAWKDRILSCNPNCQVTLISEFINPEKVDMLFQETVDYVIDACDTISTKKELIRYTVKNHIPIISSMGMGNKMNPSKIAVMDIRKTSYDPIAKTIRKMIKEEKIKEKVMVVCSTEQPIKHQAKEIASNAIVPSVAGLLCANYVFQDILKG